MIAFKDIGLYVYLCKYPPFFKINKPRRFQKKTVDQIGFQRVLKVCESSKRLRNLKKSKKRGLKGLKKNSEAPKKDSDSPKRTQKAKNTTLNFYKSN